MWLLTDDEIAAIPATNTGGNYDDVQLCKAQLKKVVDNLHGMTEYDWIQLLKESE